MSKRNFFESTNPMLKEEAMPKNNGVLDSEMVYSGDLMTVNGAVNKTLLLFGVLLATSLFAYNFPSQLFMIGGIIGGAIVSFIASRNLDKSPILAPIFAGLYGLAIGSISAIYATLYAGIIFHAVTLTMAILFTMLMLYKTGAIKVTERFRSIVMTATGAIMIVYALTWVLSFFQIPVPFLHEQSMIGIGISLFIVGVASLKLLVDFDNFDRGAAMKTPDYMEWYFGMGLLFTLVWLYTEVLWLLSAFMGSD